MNSSKKKKLDINQLDRYIKITDASRILGFASFQSVRSLIGRGKLKSYSLPETSRPRVLLSDIISLKNDLENKKTGKQTKTLKKRGRPRKYC